MESLQEASTEIKVHVILSTGRLGVSLFSALGSLFDFCGQTGNDRSPTEVWGPGLRQTPYLQEVLQWL